MVRAQTEDIPWDFDEPAAPTKWLSPERPRASSPQQQRPQAAEAAVEPSESETSSAEESSSNSASHASSRSDTPSKHTASNPATPIREIELLSIQPIAEPHAGEFLATPQEDRPTGGLSSSAVKMLLHSVGGPISVTLSGDCDSKEKVLEAVQGLAAAFDAAELKRPGTTLEIVSKILVSWQE